MLFEQNGLVVSKGEIWALTGPAGSGKTTLLKAIVAHIKTLNNLPVDVAVVSARHNFRNLSNTKDLYYQQRFNSMDAEDSETVEVYLSAVESKKKNGDWNLPKVITRLNLQHLKDKELIKLSNGETKRLLIASALLKNPDLLLLDNPLTGLDVQTRADFDVLLKEISDSGITIVLASSSTVLPAAISHVAILDQGIVVRSMPIHEFAADEYQPVQNNSIDEAELQSLLSVKSMDVYETIVGMENIHIQYGDKTILNAVDWQIKQGEHWALLGHNGAGKSTLLSLINGDNPQAYANKIVLFDKRRGTGESIWDIKKKIGFVSPEFFQYFDSSTSCLEVIESGFYDTLGLFRPSNPKLASVCKRWMAVLEIEGYAAKLFKNVPVSIQRLCLLARALVKNPPLLIFDEPCQGLDPQQAEHFKRLVDSICTYSNATLIYVSHYAHEIPDRVTRTLTLDMGNVVNNG
ncbi:ATP-binding cassette domain-containing protein [Pedobacter metabolipauper]|uniref:Molybdate transport system ATP-binding protein n=1 Tax=Pedobacter metabolipauper TaxID=425513 RepID=A0A4R6SX33_9SPHI|nr:ATP-binding cassette domain-containing protein [Pedobacter metabolipauper]TDQ11074.1 molybdate transport system ATP-binding protein [Pedobacter metabolipauper]